MGAFGDTVDFDPSPGTTTLTATSGSFALKMDSDGNFVWVGGLGASDKGLNIAVDALENMYVTGGFRDTVDFDPGDGTANLTSAGLDDIFIIKFSAASGGGGGGGDCLITSLTHGTPLHKELDTIRAFRDQILLTNPIGSGIAKLYYRISPTAVQLDAIGFLVIFAACVLICGCVAVGLQKVRHKQS